MPGFDPRLLALFCIMFIALGIFNIINGRRRMQQARTQGSNIRWYKQISILTGIEYVFLALAFLLNISITYRWLPQSLNVAILPVYLVVLIASGVLAGVIIFQGMTNARTRRAAPPSAAPTIRESKQSGPLDESLSPQERAELAQKRRERRQKAAAARRRRAGKT